MIDRLVLRLAVSEMLARADTPPVVVINEAIELARVYSGEAAVKFVNGVLDAVPRELQRPARARERSRAHMSQDSELRSPATREPQKVTALGVAPYPHRFEASTSISDAGRGPRRAKAGDELEAAALRASVAGRVLEHPQLRQGLVPGAVGRALAGAGVPAAGRAVRARLRHRAGPRLRRPRRRRGAPVPHEDQRVLDLGREASSSSPSASCRCPRSGTACRTSRRATASATST